VKEGKDRFLFEMATAPARLLSPPLSLNCFSAPATPGVFSFWWIASNWKIKQAENPHHRSF